MNKSRERRFAAMMSLLSAFGHAGVIAVTINAGSLRRLTEIIPTSTELQFVLVAGLLSLVIGLMLLLPTAVGRKPLLTALVVSVVIFATAAVKMSVTLLFVLVWPWSLYKLYSSEAG